MINIEKIVAFDKYCPRCKYYQKAENEDPCRECLARPTNMRSHKPTKFVSAMIFGRNMRKGKNR